METQWLELDRPDPRAVDGAVAVLEAARAVDTPTLPRSSSSEVMSRWRHGGDGEPSAVAVAWQPPPDGAPGSDRVAGVVRLRLPQWSNAHLAAVAVTVDPRCRRQGVGRALWEAALARVRAAGRRLVVGACWGQPASVAFLTGLGFERALDEVMRNQDLTKLDWPALAADYAAAQQRAAGYELLRLPGLMPDELLPALASMSEAINDAPIGALAIEDERFSPARVRAYEQAQLAQGRRLYRVVARERATGELAGHTVVEVSAERPWEADQGDTAVVRAHRGRRLGFLLKIEMLRWLAETEPQLREVDTGNAADNAHMIGINEQLGYEAYATQQEWQRHL